MRRRLLTTACASAALVALSGCVQATRHSNTMLFGTNTSFGIKAGTGVENVPKVLVGYDRQEAVVMPLVANTASSDRPNLLRPCDITQGIAVAGDAKFAVHPCLLVAVNGKAMDSYSVLASFGASYDVNGTGAKGGLAQYFATGVAAQLLAATGGAAVVATGQAAQASAANAPDAAATVQSLYGGDAAFQRGVTKGNRFLEFSKRFRAKIALTPEQSLQTAVRTFESAASPGISIEPQCDKPDKCSAAVTDYAAAYLRKPDAFEGALNGWTVQ